MATTPSDDLHAQHLLQNSCSVQGQHELIFLWSQRSLRYRMNAPPCYRWTLEYKQVKIGLVAKESLVLENDFIYF